MKKCISILVLLLFMLGIATSVNAYSTSEFEIDIPDSFEQVELNKYADENGRGFNIVSKPFEVKGIDPYNQATLDMIVDTLYNNLDAVKRNIKTEMESTYGSELSDEEINEYVNSFKCNSIDVKEITKCTKNNYKCFHILAQYSMADYSYYCDQYTVISRDRMYVLTLSSQEKDDFNSADLKKVLDSFTINNYKEPQSLLNNYEEPQSSFYNYEEPQSSLSLTIGLVIIAGIVVVLVLAAVSRDKNNEENINTENNANKENNANVNNNVNNGNAELPLNWWKFLKYFRFPVGILVIAISLTKLLGLGLNELNWLGWTAVIIEFVTLITCSVSYATLLSRHRNSFRFFVLNLFVESVRTVFINVLNAINNSSRYKYITFKDSNDVIIFCLTQFLILICIWIVPNYVYFKKRKAYFTKKEEHNNIAI